MLFIHKLNGVYHLLDFSVINQAINVISTVVVSRLESRFFHRRIECPGWKALPVPPKEDPAGRHTSPLKGLLFIHKSYDIYDVKLYSHYDYIQLFL